MGKADRRLVHEIANLLGLKSKSAGSGTARFPVLHKTNRTKPFDPTVLGSIALRLRRRGYFPQLAQSKKGGSPRQRRAARGGFAGSVVSYRDGEVVGAAAPELGAENKGRAMLEKMGWSAGTALGAVNNKGILQPVSHVVKTSKAGLG